MESILIFFACYVAAALLLNLFAKRYRIKLVASVAAAKRIPGLTDHKLAVLDSYVLSMNSMRTAVLLFLIYWQLLLLPKPRLFEAPSLSIADQKLFESGLMRDVLDYHIACAAAANPIFGAFAYVLRFALHYRFKTLLGAEGEKREVASINSHYAAC